MRRWLVRLCSVIVLLCPGQPAWATVGLDIVPDPIVSNESCTLTFRVIGEVDGEPDFSALEPLFDIIGRNRQTSLNWVNGRREESTVWVLSAMPRATGRIEIPAIPFGSDNTTPRTIEVVAAAQPRADSGVDILLEVEAVPREPYVQQQVIFTVRLLHRVELSSSRFSALTTSSDAIVKPLGNGRQYIEQVKGVSYDAYEQRYAVFPQKSGTLTINPIVLTTQVVTGTRGFFDPFAQSMTTRRVESRALDLTVKPVPASYPAGAAWLPARRLRLHEEWEPDVNSVEAGAPLARTLFLWADGLIAGQLPELELTPPAQVKLYPDQAQSNEQDTASGFTAVLQRKFAVIANGGGELRFAAMAIPWWNTETDSLEYARLPERALSVTGAAPAAPTPAPADTSVDAGAPPAPVAPAAGSESPAAAAGAWPAATALLGVAWLATLLAWWRAERRRRTPRTPRLAETSSARRARHARRALDAACQAGDASAAAAAVMDWAGADASDLGSPRSLGQLAERVEAPLAEALRALERHLYGRSRTAWDGAALWAAFGRHKSAPVADEVAASDPLPPLLRVVGHHAPGARR